MVPVASVVAAGSQYSLLAAAADGTQRVDTQPEAVEVAAVVAAAGVDDAAAAASEPFAAGAKG